MAVRALPRAQAVTAQHATSLPPLVLAFALAPNALDMIRAVQPGIATGGLNEFAGALGLGVLLLMWARFPRTSWLAAAAFAAGASLALRVVDGGGAQAAALLSLLSVVALGIGGAFDSTDAGSITPERV